MQYKSIPDVWGGGRLRISGARARFLREERGFTLTEMMVTIVIFIVTLFALYSVFDMSVKVFMLGNNKAEAMGNARQGLETMEREIRQAYALNRGAGNTQLLTAIEPTEIEFGNDLDGNGIIECPSEVTCEIISYSLPDGTSTLMRTSGGAPQPAVEHVDYVEFTYYSVDENGVTTETADESQVALVRIDLGITVDPPGPNNRATQELTTEVDLRNR
jgi:prepilin-type N-terminal cleavage/methylation domain-containing protein